MFPKPCVYTPKLLDSDDEIGQSSAG